MKSKRPVTSLYYPVIKRFVNLGVFTIVSKKRVLLINVSSHENYACEEEQNREALIKDECYE